MKERSASCLCTHLSMKKISTCLTSVSLAKHGLLSCIVNVQDLVENKRGKRKDLNEKQKNKQFYRRKK